MTAAPVADLDEARRHKADREQWRLKRTAEGLLRGTRLEYCNRSVEGPAVEIREREGRVFYHNVRTCSSRCCPVCAPKLAARDQAKMRDGLAIWKAAGNETYLVTFTIRHDKSMSERAAFDGLRSAQSKMKTWRSYRAIMEAAGSIGSIAAREITFGENGPHPHVHMLVFAKPGMGAVLEKIRPLWEDAVRRAGLDAVNEHGFDVRNGDYAAEYVAQYGREPSAESKRQVRAWWSVSDEMTKGHTKQTQRMGGATPMTLLRWAMEGDAQAGAMFVEHYDATKRKAQLHWSKGLRARLDLFLLERPKKKLPNSRSLVEIEFLDWHAVLRHNARWELLYVARRYGAEEVRALLDRMRRSKGRWRGDFVTHDALGLSMGYWNPDPIERREAA